MDHLRVGFAFCGFHYLPDQKLCGRSFSGFNVSHDFFIGGDDVSHTLELGRHLAPRADQLVDHHAGVRARAALRRVLENVAPEDNGRRGRRAAVVLPDFQPLSQRTIVYDNANNVIAVYELATGEEAA